MNWEPHGELPFGNNKRRVYRPSMATEGPNTAALPAGINVLQNGGSCNQLMRASTLKLPEKVCCYGPRPARISDGLHMDWYTPRYLFGTGNRMAQDRSCCPRGPQYRPLLRRYLQKALLAQLLAALFAPSPGSCSELPIAAIAAPQPIPSFVYTVKHASPNLANWDHVGLWGDDSSVLLLRATTDTPQPTWQCVADGKTDRVGKAYVTSNFPPVMRGDIVEIKARYLIAEAPSDGSLYLMDVECRDCGPRWKAGIRVYSRGGQVRVNRGKLGLQEDFISTVDERLPIGESFVLSLKLRLGDDSGETTVSVDGKPVIMRRGINMPLRRILAMRDEHLTQEQLDYVQFGITANSGTTDATVLFSNVELTTFKATPDNPQ